MFFFVKFLKCAENVPKTGYFLAPFPESCGKVVCKITIGQLHSHQALRNKWFSKRYVLAGISSHINYIISTMHLVCGKETAGFGGI
jgi:hypothetical protein